MPRLGQTRPFETDVSQRLGAKPRVHIGRLALLLGAAGLFSMPVLPQTTASIISANQLPTGAQVTAGQASVSQSGNTLNVNQTSQRAVVDWTSFNVGQDATVNFQQPNAQSATLNRVLDTQPSQILGRITAPGSVVLVNPQGVYFGKTSTVDVGGLVATTHTAAAQEFMDGQIKLTRNGATGKVENEGELRAALGGYIAMLAPEVRNNGVIVANLGTVAMAAGETFELKFDGNGALSRVVVTAAAINTLVENKSAIKAPGGLIILSAQAASRLQTGVINNTGTIEATRLVNRAGRILLEATTSIFNSGTISAADTVASTAANSVPSSGSVVAELGRIQINTGTFTQTTTGLLDVSAVAAQAGNIDIVAAQAIAVSGRIFANGVVTDPAHIVANALGGNIHLQASRRVDLTTAVLDASGEGGAGRIHIQADGVPAPAPVDPANQTPSQPLQGAVLLSSRTVLRANSNRAQAGRVEVEGDDITLDTGTLIEAKGAAGGGTVLVGGDWQGSGTLRQATTVAMSADSTIDASATDVGNGGKVVLWSDVHNASSVTTVNGMINAKGGVNGGDGGQVETSGHVLNVDGITVSTKTTLGKDGLWLLDPYDLWIRDPSWTGYNYSESGTTTYTARQATLSGEVKVSGAATTSYGGGTSSLRTDTIVNALANGNVTVLASGLIDASGWSAQGTANYYINSNSSNKLSLQAGDSIWIADKINLPSGTLELLAGTTVTQAASASITASTLILGKSNVSGANSYATPPTVDLTAASNSIANLQGSNLSSLSFSNTKSFAVNANGISSTGAVTLKSTGDISLNGALTTTASTGHISLIADTEKDGAGVVIVSSNITTSGGNLSFGDGSTINFGGVTTQVGGDVYVQGSSMVTWSTGGGRITVNGQTLIGNSQGLSVNSGGGNITFNGSIDSANQYTGVYVSAGINWDTALSQAKSGTGTNAGDTYLATITSRLENAVASQSVSYNMAWLGARRVTGIGSDSLWRWVAGPEALMDNGKGLAFSTQSASGGATSYNGYFNNWNSGEPNNAGSSTGLAGEGESTLQFTGSLGKWNDLPKSTYNLNYYVKETNATPSALTINAGAGAVSVSGSIGANKALSSLSVTSGSTATVTGSSITTTGAQSFSDGLSVTSSGSLSISGSSVTVAKSVALSGTTVSLNANLATTDTSLGDVSITGTGLTGAGNLGLAAGRALTVTQSGASVYSGMISGTGATLTKLGTGAFNLTNENTYTGGTTLSAGTLGIYSNTALGTGLVTAANGTTLMFGRVVTNFGNNVTLSGNVTFDLDTAVEYLLVGGGGGGGTRHAGGGGAGGFLTGSSDVAAGSYAVTVGAGGVGANSSTSTAPTNGGNSTLGFVATTAYGGGSGAGYLWTATSGGSGGGSNWDGASAGTGTAGQGNSGGLGVSCSGCDGGWAGGGGGGAGGAGSNATRTTTTDAASGNGGVGLASSITGTSVYYAGGGGGALSDNASGSAGLGGLGGGGNGGKATTGTNGQANTGGGGGGGGHNNAGNFAGGAGGSGIAIVRYLGSSAGTGGTVTTGSGTATGYTLHTFTSTGSSTLTLNAINVQLSGNIGGTGAMVANATGGKFNLTGTNSYSGNTTISGGTFQISGAGSLGSGSYAGTIANAGSFLYSSSANQTLSGAITGVGGLQKDTSSASTLTLSGISGYTGATNVYAGTLKITGSIYCGTCVGGSGVADTASAITTVNTGGTLELTNWNWLGSFGDRYFTSTALVIDGGTLRYSGGNTTNSGGYSRGFTVGSSGATFESATAGNTWYLVDGTSSSAAYKSVFNGNVTFAGAGDFNFSHIVSGARTLTKNGSGTLTLSGANTYTSGTNINAGTLNVGSSGALGSSGTISFGGGTLQYSASNTTDYSARVSTAANQAYSIDTNGQSVTWTTGLTSSGGSLTKLGTGTLTLSGAQTYTGATALTGSLIFQNNALPTTSGFSGTGALTIAPSTSFTTAFKPSYTFPSTLTGLTIGKSGNTADIAIPGSLSVAGSVSLYGGNVFLPGDLTSTAGGNLLLQGTADVTLVGNASTTGTFSATASAAGCRPWASRASRSSAPSRR